MVVVVATAVAVADVAAAVAVAEDVEQRCCKLLQPGTSMLL